MEEIKFILQTAVLTNKYLENINTKNVQKYSVSVLGLETSRGDITRKISERLVFRYRVLQVLPKSYCFFIILEEELKLLCGFCYKKTHFLKYITCDFSTMGVDVPFTSRHIS